jgi:mannose-6-phosphate isomerase
MPLTSPLRFVPFLRPMVWGARGLAEHLRKILPGTEPFGEAWEISDHPLHRSVVADGPYRGTKLRTLMEVDRQGLLGPDESKHDVFPWLVKFLDCRDWLSIQVHPDAQVVQKLRPGEKSKTEAWFIIKADPGSRIFAGLKPGIGPAELRKAVAEGTTHEALHSFEPKAGQCVFLPAGTVHAVGGGVLMAEIQETSDVTFRLFDWNRVDSKGRGRELHIEESFASIHWDAGPVAPIETSPTARKQTLVRCPFFNLDVCNLKSSAPLGGGKMHVLVVISGQGAWPDGRIVEAGQSWVLPAAMPAQTLTTATPMQLLAASLPA